MPQDAEIEVTPTEAAAHDYLTRTAAGFAPARAAEIISEIASGRWPSDAIALPSVFGAAKLRREIREQARTQWGAL